MDLLPTSLGTRPRLAVEIRPEGVVAARAEDADAQLTAVSFSEWPDGTVVPGLKHGNISTRQHVVAAVKRALEAVALKERQTTLVLPDAAMRVLLLDFDALPAKAAEALPVVRFRLKKLLPFDEADSVVSYQIMSSERGLIRVLAVAVPKDVLAEYEALVREAGFEPGAVLPSTLAACAGLPEENTATLLVNAGDTGVTTAIVRDGVLLLHRTVDLAAEGLQELPEPEPMPLVMEIPATLLAHPEDDPHIALPLIDAEASAGEWAMQKPLSGYGVLDESDLIDQADDLRAQIEAEAMAEAETTPREQMLPALPSPMEAAQLQFNANALEITQAISVAAAYFEDTLQMAPGVVLSAGTMGADALAALLHEAGFQQEEMRVMEMIDPSFLAAGAATTRVPRGWMAGVRGALRS